MKKRSYQSIQNRRNTEYLEGRVMGHGGNRVYGGTRESFAPPVAVEAPKQDFPSPSDWDGYNKAFFKSDSRLRVGVELAMGAIGLVSLLAALVIGYDAWWLAVFGAICLAALTIFSIVERGPRSV